MSRYQADDADEMPDFGMDAAEDGMDEEYEEIIIGFLESDDEEYDQSNDKISDTSSAQARKGKDIQGIPWNSLTITRDKYRQTRLEQYRNYENIPHSGEASEKECMPTEKGGMYYEFHRNTRSAKSTILHFQDSFYLWGIGGRQEGPMQLQQDLKKELTVIWKLEAILSMSPLS